MRFPSIPTLLRTLATFSNATFRTSSRPQAQPHLQQTLGLPARLYMPTIPFFGSLFSSSSSNSSSKMSHPADKPDSEWRTVLNKEQFRILREKGTEAPFTGEYDKHYPSEGAYTCAGCNAPLYKATHKFKSGCGWPAFFDAVPGAVTRHVDKSWGMERIEIMCSNCGGHLGHVFKGEGFPTPTDERHCVNSVSLKFNPDDKVVEEKKETNGESKV